MRLPNYIERFPDHVYLYGIEGILKNLYCQLRQHGSPVTLLRERLGKRARHIYGYVNGRCGISLWYLKEVLEVWSRATGGNKEDIFNEIFDSVTSFGFRRERRRIVLPKRITKDLAYLTGVIVGDGWITSDGGLVGVVGGDEEYLRSVIASLFKKLFECNARIRRDSRKKHTYFLEVNSKIITLFLGHVFDLNRGKKVARIPAVLQKYPKCITMGFIGGFFDADGTAGKGNVKFVQKSKEILEQIKQELEKENITASLHFDTSWNGWELRVWKNCRQKFFSLISPRLKTGTN